MTPLLEIYFQIAGVFFIIYICVSTFCQKITISKMFVGMFLSLFWIGVLVALAILTAQEDIK